MPTASGRETAQERADRQRAEEFRAIRAAITVEMLATADDDAAHAERCPGEPIAQYPAGERVELRAGRRAMTVDAGEIQRLALADALKARGIRVIGHRSSFGIGAGRESIRYSVSVSR